MSLIGQLPVTTFAVGGGHLLQPAGQAVAGVQHRAFEGRTVAGAEVRRVVQGLHRGTQVGDRRAEPLRRLAQQGVALAQRRQFAGGVGQGQHITGDDGRLVRSRVGVLQDGAHAAFQQDAAVGGGADELGGGAVLVIDVPAFAHPQGEPFQRVGQRLRHHEMKQRAAEPQLPGQVQDVEGGLVVEQDLVPGVADQDAFMQVAQHGGELGLLLLRLGGRLGDGAGDVAADLGQLVRQVVDRAGDRLQVAVARQRHPAADRALRIAVGDQPGLPPQRFGSAQQVAVDRQPQPPHRRRAGRRHHHGIGQQRIRGIRPAHRHRQPDRQRHQPQPGGTEGQRDDPPGLWGRGGHGPGHGAGSTLPAAGKPRWRRTVVSRSRVENGLVM
ncbi:hypothetical protein [Azospirillum sp. INR13]|uniref:hypothetical protein n=1 Tax=Azospirillum sp. INR13 TaxID=2596919 RepID=UPI002105026D|nr:hypothetical protein [Azospirillum sp. INR13]